MSRARLMLAIAMLGALSSACATAIRLPDVEEADVRAVENEVWGSSRFALDRERNVRYWEILLTDDDFQRQLSAEQRSALVTVPLQDAATAMHERFSAQAGIGALDIARLSPSLVRDAAAQADPAQSAELYQLANYVDGMQSVVHRRIQAVGHRVAAAAGRPDVTFIADSQVGLNAFVPIEFGANRIFVGTELALSGASDDELACSLGHELAHMTEGHTTTGAWVNVGKTTLTIAATAALAVAASQANDGRALTREQVDAIVSAGQLTSFLLADVPLRLSGWERGQEREADAVGLYYAAQAGFRPEACAENMLRMAREEAAAGDSSTISWWTVHPKPAERVVALRRLAEQARAGTLRYGR